MNFTEPEICTCSHVIAETYVQGIPVTNNSESSINVGSIKRPVMVVFVLASDRTEHHSSVA
jgi:hypothetical protein